MTHRRILLAFVLTGLVLIVSDHLLSPPLQPAVSDEVACAPCGAPCPSTR